MKEMVNLHLDPENTKNIPGPALKAINDLSEVALFESVQTLRESLELKRDFKNLEKQKPSETKALLEVKS